MGVHHTENAGFYGEHGSNISDQSDRYVSGGGSSFGNRCRLHTFNWWARLGRDVEAFLVVPCKIDVGTSAVRQIDARTYLAAMTLSLESLKVQRCEWVDAQRRQTELMDLPIKFKNQRIRNTSRTLNNQASREVEKSALRITPLSIWERSELIGVPNEYVLVCIACKQDQTNAYFPTFNCCPSDGEQIGLSGP